MLDLKFIRQYPQLVQKATPQKPQILCQKFAICIAKSSFRKIQSG